MVITAKWLIILLLVSLSLFQAHSDSLYSNDLKRQSLQDDDGDGVINARDYCKNTPSGAKIDNRGCPSSKTILLSVELEILFDVGKSNIKPHFYSEVKRLADFLRANPNSDVVIEGHTDNIGSASKNLKLSQERANAIAFVLVNSFNIPTKQITAIGYGEARPISDNGSPESRAKNRRVIAEVFAKKVKIQERWSIYSVDKNIK